MSFTNFLTSLSDILREDVFIIISSRWDLIIEKKESKKLKNYLNKNWLIF